MKKEIRELIEKLEMELTRRNGEWAIAIQPNNAPNKEEVKFITINREEIIAELKNIKDEKLEEERQFRKNTPIKVKLEKVNEYEERYVVKENKKMAEELGIGKQVGYWGVIIKDEELIKALGTEFTAEQVREYYNSKKEETITEDEKLETLIKQAKVLGHKVVVSKDTVKCNGEVEECDVDIVTKYINSKGEITYSRAHTH